MWDLLKSKVSNFIKQVKGESEEELKKEVETPEIKEEKIIEEIEIKEEEEKEEPEIKVEEIKEIPKEVIIEKKPEIKIEEVKKEPIKEVKPEIKIEEVKKEPIKKEIEIPKPKTPIERGMGQNTPGKGRSPSAVEDAVKVKVGITEKITKTLFRKIKLNKNKVNEITEELELALIQADVHPEIAREVSEKINEKLSKSEYSSNKLEEEIKNDLKEIFENEVFHNYPKINVLETVMNTDIKPYKILFVGPNGAGKTTTIAKFANMIKKNGKKVVISASDTFRAAAIEQTEEHGKRLDVKVIRQNYGADAAAVAFDAIKHAEANNVDVVLIDSAGRQDNNTNLMRELEKIKRITKPDITIFIGEAIAGNSLYQQVETYNGIVKLDGIILTKVDCDAKGGTAISIYRESSIPIIYLGLGQKYDDLKLFEPSDIIDNII